MLIGVLAVLLTLVAVLAIPVTLKFEIAWRQTLQQNIWLQWAFGLVRVRIPSEDAKADTRADTERERPEKRPRPKRPSRGAGNVFGAIADGRFRRRVMRFARDLWRAVGKENVRLRLRLGLGDPADTGQLWGAVGPVAGMLGTVREASIEIEPEFFDATFELDTSGSISIVPLKLIYLCLGLMLSPSVWRGVRTMRG